MSSKLSQRNVPPQWKRVKLEDLGNTLGGLTGKSKKDFGSGRPFIPYMNVFRNPHLDKDFTNLVEIKDGERQNQIRYGDYIFTTSSETPEEVGMSSAVVSDPVELYLNSFCFIFRPEKDLLDPTFGGYLFRGSVFRKEIAAHAKGSTRFNLSKHDFLGVSILFPESKQEQKKIAEILTSVDEEIQKTDEIIAMTKKLKHGLTQQLFTKGIGHTKYKKTEIGEIPRDWEIVNLNDISSNLDNKRIPITKSKRESGSYPYYGATGIVDYVGDYIFDEELLLISEDGANLKDRNYPIAFTAIGKYWVNNHAHLQRFEDRFLQKYIQDYLNMINLEPFLTGMAQPKLNKDRLFSIPIPKPSNIDEIKKISEVLSSVDDKMTINQELKEKLTGLKKGLMQDLLSGKQRVKV